VFTFDDITLTADDLDGVEDPDPDAGTYDRKEVRSCRLLDQEHLIAQNKCDQERYDCREYEKFPVFLVHEDTEKLSNVDFSLPDPSCTGCICCLSHRSLPSDGDFFI
jgi:hypothetical protein